MKYSSHNRDKSKYFSSTFNLKRFFGHHLPITCLQVTLKFNEATFSLKCAYVVADIHLTFYLEIIQALF